MDNAFFLPEHSPLEEAFLNFECLSVFLSVSYRSLSYVPLDSAQGVIMQAGIMQQKTWTTAVFLSSEASRRLFARLAENLAEAIANDQILPRLQCHRDNLQRIGM
jgi:hypothetical protein